MNRIFKGNIMLHFFKRYTFVLCLFLSPQSIFANVPVIDVTAIANMALQYSQMIQEAIKYEKELAKLGIDTGRVGGILGQLDSLTNGMLETLSNLEALPGTIESVANDTKNECDFLMKDEKFKAIAKDQKEEPLVQLAKDKLKEQTTCLVAVNSAKDMTILIDEYAKDAQAALKKGDLETYNHKMQSMKHLQNTRKVVQKQAILTKRNEWDNFYATYESEGKAPTSKKFMNDRYITLLENAKKSTTQTDTQNFANQVLLELLRTSQMTYEMLMRFNDTMIAMQDKNDDFDKMEKQKIEYDEKKREENKKKVDIFAEDSPFEEFKGEYKKDALGLPIIELGGAK